MSKESRQNFNRDFLTTFLPEVLYRINISQESQEKIKNLGEFLNENREVNFITYFNHIGIIDPMLVGYMVNKIDPQKTRKIITPVSYYHTESKNIKDVVPRVMNNLSNSCGVETIKVIQAYQVDNPKYGYTQSQADATYKELIREVREYKKQGILIGFIISPEGHRSEDGSLGSVEKGILLFEKILEPVILIPIGIYYDKKYSRDGLNIGKKLNLEIGESYFYEKGKERKDIDFYMNNLAGALPPEMRGYYGEITKIGGSLVDVPKIRV